MKSNLKKLDVGLRGTLNEFKATYTLGFLKKNGYNAYIPSNSFNNHPLCETVQTKYGEMVIYGWDVITYVGNGIWSTERSQKKYAQSCIQSTSIYHSQCYLHRHGYFRRSILQTQGKQEHCQID